MTSAVISSSATFTTAEPHLMEVKMLIRYVLGGIPG